MGRCGRGKGGGEVGGMVDSRIFGWKVGGKKGGGALERGWGWKGGEMVEKKRCEKRELRVKRGKEKERCDKRESRVKRGKEKCEKGRSEEEK